MINITNIQGNNTQEHKVLAKIRKQNSVTKYAVNKNTNQQCKHKTIYNNTYIKMQIHKKTHNTHTQNANTQTCNSQTQTAISTTYVYRNIPNIQ